MTAGFSNTSFPAHSADTISVQHAFSALTHFLEAFWERDGKPADSMAKLLSWTSSSAWADAGPTDPAMWADWLEAIEKTRK